MSVFSKISSFFSAKPQTLPVTNEQRSSLMNPDQWFQEWINGGKSVAGQVVTPETALKVSAVYAACNLLSRTMGSLSLGQFERLDGGGSLEVNTPESFALCTEPNEFFTSYEWRSTAMLHICLRGNHYSKLKFDRNGRVNGIEVMRPDCVTPFKYKGKLYYDRNEDGISETLTAGEVLHFKNFSDDGIIGKSPISYARETIGMSLAASNYASVMYENGGGLRGVVETPGMLKDTQVQELRTNFINVMKNYKDTGSIGVLQGGSKFTQLALSPKDAQFIENAKFSVSDIGRFYGVPLHLIGDLERSTNNNIEHQSIEYVMYSIRPVVKSWEAEINRKCIRKSDKVSLFFRFDLNSLLRGDSAARSEYYAKMLNLGVYSLDEVRALENMNPIADGIGKSHYMQTNMATLENINAGLNAGQNTGNGNTQV